MSKMKDLWGDTIEFLPGFHRGTVEVVFHGSDEAVTMSMNLDQRKARQFINKLLKSFEEVEDE